MFNTSVRERRSHRISCSACVEPRVVVPPLRLVGGQRSASTSQSLSSMMSPRELVSRGNSSTAGDNMVQSPVVRYI